MSGNENGNRNRNVANLNNKGNQRVNSNGRPIFRNTTGLYTRANNGSRVNYSNAPVQLSPQQKEVLEEVIGSVQNGLEKEATQVAELATGISGEEAGKAGELLPALVAAVGVQLSEEELKQLRSKLNAALNGVQRANAASAPVKPSSHHNTGLTHRNGPSHWNGPLGHSESLLTEAAANAEKAGNNALAAVAKAANASQVVANLSGNQKAANNPARAAENARLADGSSGMQGGASKKKPAPKKKAAPKKKPTKK